jgi:IS605 OrfB family transposase
MAGDAQDRDDLAEGDGWCVSFSCADVPVRPLPPTGQASGIDLGIEAFAALSDGTPIFHLVWYRKAERAPKTAQRRVSRRKKGSHRRRKAVTLLAKAYQQVRRQRTDFHHKTALALVQTNDVIYHEDMRMANRVNNHHLAKSISDAELSAFLLILHAKAASAGRGVIAVNPAYTSQMWSGRGALVAKGCERVKQRARSASYHERSLSRKDERGAENNPILQKGQGRRTRNILCERKAHICGETPEPPPDGCHTISTASAMSLPCSRRFSCSVS